MARRVSAATAGAPLDEAVDLTGIPSLQLIQQLASPAIHSYETSAGRLFICQGSLKTFSNGVK